MSTLLSGSLATGLQGTPNTNYASPTRNLFAVNGRLRIQKIGTGGAVDTLVYDMAAYENFGTTTEGGGSSGVITTSTPFTAELDAAATLSSDGLSSTVMVSVNNRD